MAVVITVEVPIEFLMQIAVYGKMGTGELPDLMKTWAQRELEKAGLGEELKDAQIGHLKELHKSLANVLGPELMASLDDGIAQASKALKNVKLKG